MGRQRRLRVHRRPLFGVGAPDRRCARRGFNPQDDMAHRERVTGSKSREAA